MTTDVVYFFDIELVDDFRDELIYVIENLESDILALQNDEKYIESVNHLFRVFHSLKAHGSYVGANEMVKVFKVIEDALHILRNKKPPVKQEVIDWLLLILDFLQDWVPQIEKSDFDIDPIDSYTLNMVKIASLSTVSTDKIMEKLTVLIIGDNKEGILKIDRVIEKFFRKVFKSSIKKAVESAEHYKSDIIVVVSDLQDTNGLKAIEDIRKILERRPFFVVASKKPEKDVFEKLKKISVDTISPITTESNSIVEKLRHLAEANYGNKWISIEDQEVKEIISNIAPLPDTIVELQKAVVNPKTSPRDISTIISKDPILMAKMLKVVNSPIFGLRSEVTNIQNAVTLLGKERISALAMQESISTSFKIPDLSVYGINELKYFELARKRMELMTAWYSKVSFGKLAILATSSLLGSLGQLLLANKIKKENRGAEFSLLLNDTAPIVAESEILNTTSEDVTADILGHWEMSNLLVDSIRYSFNLSEAPSEVKQYAIANYVVFYTVASASENQNELKNTIEEMAEFLEELNLEADAYKKACEKVLEIS